MQVKQLTFYIWTLGRLSTHNKSLGKLWSVGIRGKLWHWFKLYPDNRHLCVKINNHFSSMLPVISGVPQKRYTRTFVICHFIKTINLTVYHHSLLIFLSMTPNVWSDLKCNRYPKLARRLWQFIKLESYQQISI